MAISPETVGYIDHEQGQIRRIRDSCGGDIHKVFQAPVLFSISKINYHPQSGWFEDAPLKGGAVMACALFRGHCYGMPPQGALLPEALSEGTVVGCPPSVAPAAQHPPLARRARR